MKCQFCGKDIKAGSKFCDGCGAKQEEVSAPVSNPNVGYYQPPKKNTGLIVTIMLSI